MTGKKPLGRAGSDTGAFNTLLSSHGVAVILIFTIALLPVLVSGVNAASTVSSKDPEVAAAIANITDDPEVASAIAAAFDEKYGSSPAKRSLAASADSSEVVAAAAGTPPSLISISPSSGPTSGGTSVTIYGWDCDGITSVTFGGTSATYSVSSIWFFFDYLYIITATSPAHSAGTFDVVVTTNGGSDSISYTYYGTPTITGISPNYGTTNGGTSVTITGTSLATVSGVTFDGSSGSITSSGDTQIVVTTPRHTQEATVDVVVTTDYGSETASDAYTYIRTNSNPSVSSVTPSSGPTSGGTTVIITGTRLIGVTSVTFDNIAATDVTAINNTAVSAVTPARSSAGYVTVRVTTSYGRSGSRSNAFQYIAQNVAISLNQSSIYLPMTAGSTATNSSLGITVTANCPFTITVADSTGRSANLGYMGNYSGSSYVASGPVMHNPLGLAGTTSGAITAQSISPPITSTAQTLYRYTGSSSFTSQVLSPNTFSQVVSITDPHLPTGSATYRIDLTFTIITT